MTSWGKAASNASIFVFPDSPCVRYDYKFHRRLNLSSHPAVKVMVNSSPLCRWSFIPPCRRWAWTMVKDAMINGRGEAWLQVQENEAFSGLRVAPSHWRNVFNIRPWCRAWNAFVASGFDNACFGLLAVRCVKLKGYLTLVGQVLA